MGIALFAGCLLTALGPATIVFLFAVAPHANLVVLTVLRCVPVFSEPLRFETHCALTHARTNTHTHMGSAFFWVCSMCAVSLVWLAVPALHQSKLACILLAVVTQVHTCRHTAKHIVVHYMYIHTHTYISIHIYVYTYIYVYMYMYMYVYMIRIHRKCFGMDIT